MGREAKANNILKWRVWPDGPKITKNKNWSQNYTLNLQTRVQAQINYLSLQISSQMS